VRGYPKEENKMSKYISKNRPKNIKYIGDEEWKAIIKICNFHNAEDLEKPTQGFPSQNIEIQGCWKDEDGNCEAGAEGAEADIWSIYVHTSPCEEVTTEYLLEHGPTCWFADFNKTEEARAAAKEVANYLGLDVHDFS